MGGRTVQRFGLLAPYWEATRSSAIDLGKAEKTGKAEDKYVFKVPSMRNVARTAPYFHDGSVRSLEDAVRVMARVQLGQALSDATVADIVSFLDSLTGEPPSHYTPPTTLPRWSTGAR